VVVDHPAVVCSVPRNSTSRTIGTAVFLFFPFKTSRLDDVATYGLRMKLLHYLKSELCIFSQLYQIIVYCLFGNLTAYLVVG
jgi:hypothetical protein